MPSITCSDICLGGKGKPPMKYNRLWNNSFQILEQVIEGIPLFSP